MSQKKEIGIIKWFNQEKKFGLIGAPNKEDYFLYYANAIDPETAFKKGMIIHFEKGYDEKRDKKMAFKICPLSIEDHKAMVHLLDKDTLLGMEQRNIRKSRNRNKKEDDIFIKGLAWLYNKYSVEEFADFIIDCFKYSQELNDQFKVTFSKSLGTFLKNIPDENEYSWLLEDKDEELIEKVEQGVDENTIALLWIEGLYDFYGHRSNNGGSLLNDLESPEIIKFELPFNQEKLIQYADQLSITAILDLINYEVNTDILLDIITTKYQSKRIQKTDLDDLEKIFSTFENHSDQIYNRLESKLNDELTFNAWKDKKYKISSSNHTITRPLGMQDFKIEKSILLKFSHELTLDEIARVSKLYDQKILKRLLVNIFEGPNKLESPEDKYSAIIKIKDNKYRKEVQEVFISYCLEDTTEFLLKSASTQFLKECLEIIIGFDQPEKKKNLNLFRHTIKQEGSNLNIKDTLYVLDKLESIDLIEYYGSNIENLSDEEKIKFVHASSNSEIKKLTLDYWDFDKLSLTESLLKIVDPKCVGENKSFESTLVNNLENHEVFGLIETYKKTKLEFIKSEIFKRISFTNTYEIEKLLEISNESDKEIFLNSFYEAVPNLDQYDFLRLLEIFSNRDITIKSEIIENRISSIKVSDLETLFSKIDFLLSIDKRATIEGFKGLIENKKEELPLVEIITNVLSVEVAEKALRHYQFNNNEKLINLLKERDVLKKLPSSLMEEKLKKISSQFPYEVLKFASKNYPAIIKELTGSLVVDKNNIVSVLNLIDESIVAHTDSEYRSDFFILAKFLKPHCDEESITNLNEFLEEKNYSVQIILYKYLVYLYQNKNIDFTTLEHILSELKTVQLSSLLVKLFITGSFENRNQLMDKMNRLLKEHFTLLRDQKLTQKSFDQIFSLSGLVKKCNGRKSFGGVNFWQGGNITRYYTDGDHYVVKSEVLDIYCEGRFWKKQQFYDSDTNKPTGESCSLYWCRNDKCVGVNDNVNLSLPFEQWTLNELNEVFNKELDRLAFTYLAGWLNRMDTILHKLDCHSCGELIRPKNFVPNKLGYYAVPLFNCVNSSCENQGKTIRFTHCRGCKKILDSRECETCNNCNWLICNNDKCGKCGCGANYDPKYVDY